MVGNSKYALLVPPVKRFKGAQSLSSVWSLQYLLVRLNLVQLNIGILTEETFQRSIDIVPAICMTKH